MGVKTVSCDFVGGTIGSSEFVGGTIGSCDFVG